MRTNEWTEAEIDLLRRRRAERIPVPEIAAELGRPVAATYTRARKIGTRVMDRRVWTDAEIERLKALDGERVTIRKIAAELDRPEASVRWKLDELGLGGKRIAYWTDAADAVLRRLAGGKKIPEIDFIAILAALASIGDVERTEATVEMRLKTLKLVEAVRPRWTRDEVKALKTAAADGDLEGFAGRIGRPLARVKAKASAMGFVTLSRKYTTEEDQAIREGVEADKDFDDIGRELDRSPRGVRLRAIELEIIEVGEARRIDEADRQEIIAAATGGMTITEAAKALGHDNRTLRAVADEAGVEFVRARVPAKPVSVVVRSPSASLRVSVRAAAPPRARTPAQRPAVARVVVAAKPRAERKVLVRLSTGSKVMTPLARMDMSAEIARFMTEKGVTRVDLIDPVGSIVTGLRRRGYSVVGGTDGWLIDGRVSVPDEEALAAFARLRGVETGVAMQAAR